MATKQPTITVDKQRGREDRDFLEAMATDIAGDAKVRARAALILQMLSGSDLATAAKKVGMGLGTARDKLLKFNVGGWKSLLTVMAPRGGDFIARYDQGFWAERLTRVCLDQSKSYRAIPYGTSRSEPFTDLQSFRQHVETDFLLQAWSAQGRWKRPDLVMVPRKLLKDEKGNDSWTPDLQHLDNEHCRPYVAQASAAIEVETSLWETKRATVQLSFTVKQEDLEALRNWVKANKIPLYIVQVFYDSAYALPFTTVEEVIGLPATHLRYVAPIPDRITKKPTYKIPLPEGVMLGDMPEPDVEGKIFKAPSGKVTVYGRLTGSSIVASNQKLVERLADGTLKTGMDPKTAAVVRKVKEIEEGEENNLLGLEDI
jgi:hypothetical protein